MVLVKDYPIEIRERIREICIEQNTHYHEEMDISGCFEWSKSREGLDFWMNIYYGETDKFYELYPVISSPEKICISTLFEEKLKQC